MDTRIHLTGQWVDVDTFTTIDNAGHPIKELDGGIFAITDFTVVESSPDAVISAAQNAFVSFELLVNQDFKLGEHFTIDGAIVPAYLTTATQAAVSAQHIAIAADRITHTVTDWANTHVQNAKKRQFQALTHAFRRGDLNIEQWLADQQALLFEDRAPNGQYVKLQDRMAPLIANYNRIVDTAAEYTLVFTTVDNISAAASDVPLSAPGEVHLIREVIHPGQPMRANYKAEWAKYRQAAKDFQKK